MIDPEALMVGILFGCVLVALGLIPGLFQGLTEAIAAAERSFHDKLLFHRPLSAPRHTEFPRVHRPVWLAGLGGTLIVLSILAYFSR